jgi:hypothetical protein
MVYETRIVALMKPVVPSSTCEPPTRAERGKYRHH